MNLHHFQFNAIDRRNALAIEELEVLVLSVELKSLVKVSDLLALRFKKELTLDVYKNFVYGRLIILEVFDMSLQVVQIILSFLIVLKLYKVFTRLTNCVIENVVDLVSSAELRFVEILHFLPQPFNVVPHVNYDAVRFKLFISNLLLERQPELVDFCFCRILCNNLFDIFRCGS